MAIVIFPLALLGVLAHNTVCIQLYLPEHLDTDYQAAFDFLVMSWVFLELERKGLSQAVISRLKNLYQDNLYIIVVNNIEGKCVQNIRLSLRQGDIPSM